MKYVIGVDLGTSGVKCLLLSHDGEIVGIQTQSYSPDFGANGHVEQHPSVWWENTSLCIKNLINKFPEAKGNVQAIGTSGQMHGSVFLDKDGEVIRPAILWNDTRTTPQTKEIYEKVGGETAVLELVYNRALEGFTLPKVLWLKSNEPDNYAKVDKVVLPKDYINYKLTGKLVTDYSDAAGTLMFDVKKREFNTTILEKVGVSPDVLPKAIESTGEVGVILADVASELGCGGDVKIIAGGADNSCAAIGNGVVSPGQAVVSVGTSGTVVAFLEDIQAEVTGDVHLFNYSYPKSMYAMGCMLSAGESFSWLQKNILTELSFDELNVLVEKTPAGSNRLVFLPYLFGERCPYSDANARGVFFGLSSMTGKGEMARAVMEGVAFGLKDMFGQVSEFTKMNEIYITGGGAKSAVWGGIIASILNQTLYVLNVEEGPAFGAALIAAVGSGVFASFEEAKNKTMKVIKTIEPNEEDRKVYETYYPLYQKLYAANKDLFAQLAVL